MSYKIGEETLKGIWGLEERLYSEEEIKASFHLQAAVNAGALVKTEREPRAEKIKERKTEA